MQYIQFLTTDGNIIKNRSYRNSETSLQLVVLTIYVQSEYQRSKNQIYRYQFLSLSLYLLGTHTNKQRYEQKINNRASLNSKVDFTSSYQYLKVVSSVKDIQILTQYYKQLYHLPTCSLVICLIIFLFWEKRFLQVTGK